MESGLQKDGVGQRVAFAAYNHKPRMTEE